MNNFKVKTSDSLDVCLHEFSDSKSKICWLVIPGFFQHSKSEVFYRLCDDLAKSYEDGVFCLDLRGTGQSQGTYTFGQEEYLDVAAAITFLRSKYSEIKLLGFSLGAYSSLRSQCEALAKADKMFLVSCPTSVTEIIYHGHAIKHSVSIAFDTTQLKRVKYSEFRLGNPFNVRPNAKKFAKNSQIPSHFLVGSKDFLVPSKMSAKVFNQVVFSEKTFVSFEGGRHAELLYTAMPQEFKDWLQK